jgi:hypothetical protein
MDVKPKRKYTRKIKVIVNKVVENEDNNMNIVNSTCNEISKLSLNDNHSVYMYITCQKVFKEQNGKEVYRDGYQYLFGVLFFFTATKFDNLEHLIIKSFTINDSKNGDVINVSYIDLEHFYGIIDSKTTVYNKYYIYDFVNKDNIIDSLLMNNDLFINADNSSYSYNGRAFYVNIKDVFENINI